MIQVSYVSRTDEPMSGEQLLDLLLQCRSNNSALGVTGMLLYGNGTFLQAIEGEEDVIDDLKEKIWKDPRHADIQLLSRKEIEQRQYSDWSMGFEQVTDDQLGQIEGLKDFGASDFNFDYLIGHGPVVESLMDHFRQPHWDQVLGELDAKDKVIEHLNDALTDVRDRAAIACLALESLTEASRQGQPSESLLRLCDAALDSLRPR
jgi:hypothetical protein